MSDEEHSEALQAVLEHIATEPSFRSKLEESPLETLDEFGIQVDEETRAALEGKRFSEFVAEVERSASAESRNGELTPEEAEMVAGGGTIQATFAPPYVPVGPVVPGDKLSGAWSELLLKGKVDGFRRR